MNLKFARWKDQVMRSRPLRKVVLVSRKLVLPGFQGLSVYQVFQFLLKGLQNGRLNNRASAVSFKVLLAIPPLFIVLLSLIPFIPIENFQESLFQSISSLMPVSAFALVEQTLADLINRKQQTLFSISFILALFYASNAIAAILDGFGHSYHLEKTKGPLLKYSLSLGLMVVLSFIVVLGVALITFSGAVFSYLRATDIIGSTFIVVLLEIAKWIVVIVLFEMGISLLYRAGHTGKWRAVNAGASFATLGLIVVSLLFAWYVNNFGNYNKLYGSVGTVLVVMLWLYFNSIVLLIGFEINTSIEKAKFKAIDQINPEEIL